MVPAITTKQYENFRGLSFFLYLRFSYFNQSISISLLFQKLFLEEASNPPSEQSSYQESGQNLCIVCQLLPISRAIIPCGHACLCVLCFEKMNACPMCRNAITSSFILREEPNVNHDDQQFSDVLKRMNPVEIIRGIYNAS